MTMNTKDVSRNDDAPTENVFFPQTCTHMAHDFNNEGELRTVLVTGGDRLVFLKDGVRIAESGPLFRRDPSLCDSHITTRSSLDASPAEFPQVKHISICPFFKDAIRVVMVTTDVVCVFEVDDSNWVPQDPVLPWGGVMPPKGSQAAPSQSSPWPSPLAHSVGNGGGPLPSPSKDAAPGLTSFSGKMSRDGEFRVRGRRLKVMETTKEQSPVCPVRDSVRKEAGTGLFGSICGPASILNPQDAQFKPTGFRNLSNLPNSVPVRRKTRHTTIVTAAFVTEHTICLVYDDEAILVELSSSVWDFSETTQRASAMVADAQVRTVWRSMGAYTALAVCRFSSSVALSLRSSTIVVFPANVKPHGVASYDCPTSPMIKTPNRSKLPFVSLAPMLTPPSNALFTGGGSPAGGGVDMPTASLPLGSTHTEDCEGVRAMPDSSTILSEHGLTAFLGIYRIHCMEWHCVFDRTLLCVTCVHPRDGGICAMLYTIHSLPTVPHFSNTGYQGENVGSPPNPYVDIDDGESGAGSSGRPLPFTSTQRRDPDRFLQLVPMGVIPFTGSPVAEPLPSPGRSPEGPASLRREGVGRPRFVRYATGQSSGSRLVRRGGHLTGVVPHASVPSRVLGHTGLLPSPAALGHPLQFLHVEADGTVWTSCYRVAHHAQSSAAVQRAQGLACARLLAPLFARYGTPFRVDVLPGQAHRVVEMGTESGNGVGRLAGGGGGTAAPRLPGSSARRYRFVGHFDRSGVVAVVMVDLSVAVYRVEAFLAVGSWPICSLCTLEPPFGGRDGGDGEQLVAALLADTKALSAAVAGVDGSKDADQPSPRTEQGNAAWMAENQAGNGHGCWGVAIFSQRWTFRGFVSALLVVAPFPEPPPQQQQVVLATSVLSEVSSPRALGRNSTMFQPINNEELELTAAMGAARSMQCRYSDKTCVSSVLPKTHGSEEDQGLNLEQVQHCGQLGIGNAVAFDEREGQLSGHFSSPGVHSNVASHVTLRDSHTSGLQYVLRGGCVMPDGECLYLSTFYDLPRTGEAFTAAFSGDMQSSPLSPCSDVTTHIRAPPAGFLILLAPPELESPDPLCAKIAVGGAHIARAAPAALVQTPSPFFRPWELVENLSNIGIGEPKEEAGGTFEDGVDSSIPKLQRVISYLQEVKSDLREVRCKVVALSPSTEAGISIPVWGVRVQSPVLPPPWVEIPIAHERYETITCIIDLQGQIVMNDTIIGVLVRKRRLLFLESIQGQELPYSPGESERRFEAGDTEITELLLYGIPAMQPDRRDVDPVFDLEKAIPDVGSFLLGSRGEVLVQHRRRLSRWLRCFPSFQSGNGEAPIHRYNYIEDVQHRMEWGRAPLSSPSAVQASHSFPAASQSMATSSGVKKINDFSGGDIGDLLGLTCITEPVTAMVAAMDGPIGSKQSERRCRAAPQTYLIASFSSVDYLRMLPIPFASGSASFEDGVRPVVQYHPESVMQLIGMERWEALGAIWRAVATAATAAAAVQSPKHAREAPSDTSIACLEGRGGGGEDGTRGRAGKAGAFASTAAQADALAHEFCASRGGASPSGRPLWASCTPAPVPFDAVWEENATGGGTPLMPCDHTACHSFDVAVDGALLQDLRVLLPKVSLHGLSSREHLDLVCIVEALGEAHRIGSSLDEAASRFYFFYKLNELRRRLHPRGPGPAMAGPAGGVTIIQFATDRTAARVIATMSYLWAAMSDSQASILRELLPGLPMCLSYRFSRASMSSGTGGEGVASSSRAITWELLEKCGVAYWVRDPEQLRALADALAREQFRATRSIQNCALMYCVAGNVNTLVALCKERKETKLRDFYSRDFSEGRNRTAAAANAYAALGKNLISFAASFFLLAGDLRSAVQVILQRQQNPSLALFVLRASVIPERNVVDTARGTTCAENLRWFREVWHAEQCGAQMDQWLQSCLYWLTGRPEDKVTALRCLAQHPTGHPEALCVLRHARRRVVELAQRGGEFLSFERELTCLLRLGRYCQVHRLDLNAQLHYANVWKLLKDYCNAAARAPRKMAPGACAELSSSELPEEKPKAVATKPRLQADYNTGTLMFGGFDDDESDDDKDEGASTTTDPHAPSGAHGGEQKELTSANSRGLEGAVVDAPESPVLGTPKRLVDMIKAEIAYATLILRRTSCADHRSKPHPPQAEGGGRDCLDYPMHVATAALSITDTGLYSVLCPLLLSVIRESPSAEIERCLAKLLAYFLPDLERVVWSPPPCSATRQAPQSPSYSPQNRIHVIFVMVLLLSLSGVATRVRNQSLACALARVSCYSLDDLVRGAAFVGTPPATARGLSSDEVNTHARFEGPPAPVGPRVHPVVAFWSCLRYHLTEFCPNPHHDGERAPAATSPGDTFGGLQCVDHAGAGTDGSDSREDPLPVPAPEYEAFCQSLLAAALNEKDVGVAAEGSALGPVLERQPVVREADFLEWHFAWLSSYISAHALQELRNVSEDNTTTADSLLPAPQSGPWDGVSSPCREGSPEYKGTFLKADSFDMQDRFELRVLLYCSMAYATLRFDRLTVECYTRLQRFQPDYNIGRLSAPNGMFVEAKHTLTRILEALCALLEVVLASSYRAMSASEAQAGPSWGCCGKDTTSNKVRAEKGLEGDAAGGVFSDFPPQNPSLWRVSPASILALLGQLCVSHVVLFSELPSVGQIASLEGLRRRLAQTLSSSAGARNNSGAGLCQQEGASGSANPIFHIFDAPAGEPGCGGGCRWELAQRGRTVLERMESSWQRLHHTHRSFRDLLLAISTKGTLLDDPLVTERLLLSHSSHSIRYLDFDYSSCESLVWATEAGLSVSHGFRELLASDHEDALRTQIPERNMATMAFSRGFEAQQRMLDTLHTQGFSEATTAVGTPPPPTAAAALATRPRAAIALSNGLTAHPNLPFFLSNHPDGHLDLYSFASTECIASYSCPGGSAATTPVSFSTNGWQFTVGLQDGSVAGWRFTAMSTDRALLFYLPSWFLPSGVKAVFFFGEQTSMVVAVGTVCEPHCMRPILKGPLGAPNDLPRSQRYKAQSSGAAVQSEGRDADAPAVPWFSLEESGLDESGYLAASAQDSLPSASLVSLSNSSSRRRRLVPATTEVSELLIVDTVLKAGEVVVRCVLPFPAEFAVYLPTLEAVLVVSLDGRLAAYLVRRGRLVLLSEVPLVRLSLPRPQAGREAAMDLSDRAAAEIVTAVAVSPYDPLLALGTSTGYALLLSLGAVAAAASAAAVPARRQGAALRMDSIACSGEVKGPPPLLQHATRLPMAPLQGRPNSLVFDLKFAPSVILAGLKDGSLMAARLIPEPLRRSFGQSTLSNTEV